MCVCVCVGIKASCVVVALVFCVVAVCCVVFEQPCICTTRIRCTCVLHLTCRGKTDLLPKIRSSTIAFRAQNGVEVIFH